MRFGERLRRAVRGLTGLYIAMSGCPGLGAPDSLAPVPASSRRLNCPILLHRLGHGPGQALPGNLENQLRAAHEESEDYATKVVLADALEEYHPSPETVQARVEALRLHAEVEEQLRRHGASKIDDLPLAERFQARARKRLADGLFKRHGKHWVPKIDSVTAYEFKGGVLWGAEVDWEDVVNRLPRRSVGAFLNELRRAGIKKLTLKGFLDSSDSPFHQLNSPGIEGFTHLKLGLANLNGQPVNMSGIDQNPYLRSLEHLEFEGNPMRENDVRSLLSSPNLGKLKSVGNLHRLMGRPQPAEIRALVRDRGPELLRREMFLTGLDRGVFDFKAPTLLESFPNAAERNRVLDAMMSDARFRKRVWEEPIVEIAALHAIPGLEPATQAKLVDAYLSHHGHPTKLVTDLEARLKSTRRDQSAQGRFALAALSARGGGPFEAVRALKKILETSKDAGTWAKARDQFLASDAHPSEKATYLGAHLNESWAIRYLTGPGSAKNSAVRNEVEARSSYLTFLALAKKHSDAAKAVDLLQIASLTSFEFQNFAFPEEGVRVIMGTEQRGLRHDRSLPLTAVTMKDPYGIARTTLTKLQLALIQADKLPKPGKLDAPAVSDMGADDFSETSVIQELNRREESKPVGVPKYEWKIPSPNQWEFAARAGTRRPFHSAQATRHRVRDYAWLPALASRREQPVAEKRPNDFGLYDTGGNVWEWVLDETRNGQTMVRGGSVFEGVLRADVAEIAYFEDAPQGTGLRLVRVPK